tara:strand:- start:1332 stop:1922 length:591 start_codon:yes stop_codon:yes gene_type:complete
MQLSVNIKNNNTERKYKPLASDIYQAVCVDIEDIGWKKTDYGWKGFIKFYFETYSDGKPMLVKSRRLNAVISPRSTLYKLLKRWMGEDLDTANNLDLTSLIGKPATIVVEDGEPFNGNDGEQIQWSFVEKVKPCKEDVEPSGTYTPVTERDGYEPPAYSAFSSGPPEAQQEREEKKAAAKAQRETVEEVGEDAAPF